MGKSRIGYRTDAIQEYYAFDFHEGQILTPAATKKPGIVLVNFTCDTFDKERPTDDIGKIFEACAAGGQHKYVFLTKNPGLAKYNFGRHVFCVKDYDYVFKVRNWYLGLSICNQVQHDEKIDKFAEIGDVGCFNRVEIKKWLSIEPLWQSIRIRQSVLKQMSGVIVGHDNIRSAPGTETHEHIKDIIAQCFDANVPCYVKQAWVRHTSQGFNVTDRRSEWCSADKFKFAKEANDLPGGVRIRNLPWAMPCPERVAGEQLDLGL